MLHLYKGQISLNELLNLTYKEIGYLREFRQKRIEKNGGADEAAGAIARLLTGGKP